MIKMDRVNSFSPTPSSSYQQQVYFNPSQYPQIDPSLQYETAPQPMMTPHGQMVMHMTHAPSHVMNTNLSPYILEEGMTPYNPHMMHPSMHRHQVVSPTDHLDARHQQQQVLQRNNLLPGRPVQAVNRPMMTRGHSIQVPPRPAGLQRQASLQQPHSHRSASPHMMTGDIFDPQPGPGSPVKRPATVAGEVQQYEAQDMFFQPPFGISPARAMGPPPMQPPRFSPHHQELMITPYGQKTGVVDMAVPSSAASSSSSSLSSIHDPAPHEISDDDNDDSPTKGASTTRAMSKMQLNEKNASTRSTRAQTTIVVRPPRPGNAATAIMANTNPNIVKPGVGGRTSAKFAKVAEDPGVEGIPPGPRSLDRPGPSFACIIGQAILRCKAGGLSLEHIYRYVETAYPFFKNDNPAWRNSVRHNLSIHKMFATIARTEKFPPGKGGIWIIHEDEKCHWPEDNKFIKNFPSSHPHYAVCRQTLHDREKEQAQMEKAAKEGRVYVPKKGKKGRKLPGEDGMDMARTSSDPGDHYAIPDRSVTPLQFQELEAEGEDEGEFLPLEEEATEVKPEPEVVPPEIRLAQGGAMVPPRFERKEKKRLLEDEGDVFVAAKRVRVAEPMPLSSIPIPQEQAALDDTFITPERERPVSNAKLMSSAFKTPALVNTSSSPGSSPMPPTVTRTTHHPSTLAQAWTHDDMAATVESSSPQLPMLDAAFDFQPKQPKTRMRTMGADDDMPIVNAANPPKTPLTRSSAAREVHKTPGGMLHKSPLTFGRSPAQPPPSVSALLSTPMWEIGGCLDRMKDHPSSPTHPIRSPMPPTSPTRYAMLLGSSTSPSAKNRVQRDFSL